VVTLDTYREAERAVVGAALLNPESIRFALDHCTPDDFLDPTLAAVYDVMIGHRSAGLPVDEVTIAKAVAERGVVGITPMTLFQLRESTPTAANVAFYAEITHEGSTRRKLRKAGTRMVQLADSDEALTSVMTHSRGEWEAVQAGLGSRIVAKPLRDVLAGSDEYDWLIPNLLERQDRVIITGGEGAGKTYLMRQIAVMAAAGLHPTLLTPIRPVRVLVVDVENTEKQWRRAVRTLTLKARMAGTADPAEALHLACHARIDITTERDLGAIHRLVDEHTPDMLLIGPLYKLTSKAINSDDDAAPLIAALDTLRDRNLTLVLEAHAGHAIGQDGNRNLRPRGSAALLGWPEFGLGIAADGGEDPTLFHLVRWRGDRDERAWPESLRRGGDWPWQDDNPTATRGKIRRLESVHTSRAELDERRYGA
jgi:hypothetical protein